MSVLNRSLEIVTKKQSLITIEPSRCWFLGVLTGVYRICICQYIVIYQRLIYSIQFPPPPPIFSYFSLKINALIWSVSLLEWLVWYIGVLHMSSNPSFIYRNRCGIFCFQRRIPEYCRKRDSQLPLLFRKSLGTKNRRIAQRRARKLSASPYIACVSAFSAQQKFIYR